MLKQILLAICCEERLEIVGVIVEEGAFAVGSGDGIPLLLLPVVVGSDEDIGGLLCFHHRYGQTQNTVGSGYLATVSDGLLHVILVLLNDSVAFEQSLEP